MVFERRVLDDIADDEIADLVEAHVSERQYLEFKATFDYKNDRARLELLRDIVSMANGGGGYLVLGIRDDGRGRAQSFVEPALMTRSDSMIRSIRGLCHDHIAEPIEGIEIRSRNVKGHSVIVVRVPVSARRPHMVTLHRRTDFWTRVEDGKRQMSVGEIREAFVKDPIGMRLDSIDARLSHLGQGIGRDQRKKELTEASKAHVSAALVRSSDGSVVAEIRREHFENEVGERPFLWLSATPVTPRRRLIAVDEPEIVSMLSAPPGSRRDGWNMAGLDHSQRRTSLIGIQLGTKEHRYLEVLENGHLEFWTPLNESFCRNQSAEERRVQPRLYPYPVVEYPVSFLYLASALLAKADYSGELWTQLQYRNVKGYVLPPGQPRDFIFNSPFDGSTPFAGRHLLAGPIRALQSHFPHKVAFALLKDVYRAFGVQVKHIPFRDSGGAFSFG